MYMPFLNVNYLKILIKSNFRTTDMRRASTRSLTRCRTNLQAILMTSWIRGTRMIPGNQHGSGSAQSNCLCTLLRVLQTG